MTAQTRTLIGSLVVVGLTTSIQADKMYWADTGATGHNLSIPGGRIRRASLNGTCRETLIADDVSPFGLALDLTHDTIYWSDQSADTIERAKLDGSRREVLLTSLRGIGRIALDVPAGRIYWAQRGEDRAIRRASLDGTNIVIVIPDTSAVDLALDLRSFKVYWNTPDAIYRANLNGSSIETVHIPARRVHSIALDSMNEKIYWSLGDSGVMLDAIERANVDGTQVETILSFVSSDVNVQGIYVDSNMGKLYWTHVGTLRDGPYRYGRIQRANLDGTDSEDILADLVWPRTVVVVPEGDIRDCNCNGTDDEVDIIADATSRDCNGNAIPDECDIAAGRSQDCNSNEIPDKCELRNGTSTDCNVNGILDDCDLTQGTSADCNGTGTLDECDLAEGIASDCNANSIPDACEIDDRSAIDCNGNGIPDECEADCDESGIPDDCELTSYTFASSTGPFPIPAEGTLGTTLATIDVPVSMVVQNIDVELDITHSFDRDLTATLASPSGREVLLFANVGGSGADFRGTTLDDEATIPIELGRAPFAGTFRPQEPLAGFVGENAFGTWTLKIVDDQAGDAGMLSRWALVFPAVNTDCDGNSVPDECQTDSDSPCAPGDFDLDGDIDLSDFLALQGCLRGPHEPAALGCQTFDFDGDGNIDLADFVAMQAAFTGAR